MMAQITAVISFYRQVSIMSSKAKEILQKMLQNTKTVEILTLKMQHFEY